MTQHWIFQTFFTTLIIINTIILACDRYPMREAEINISDAITFVLVLAFTIEISLGIIGNGLIKYFGSNFNRFDFFIVLLSLVELSLVPVPLVYRGGSLDQSTVPKGSISALRSFRLLRLLRVFRSKSLKIVLFAIGRVIYGIQSFLFIFILYLFIMALVGMQFFANRFRFEADGEPALPILSPEWENAPDRPRSNFDDFSHSFATVFQIVTVDNWFIVMWDCQRSVGQAAALFPVFVLCSGCYVIMGMFLAILIHYFTKESNKKQTELEAIVSSTFNGSNEYDFGADDADDANDADDDHGYDSQRDPDNQSGRSEYSIKGKKSKSTTFNSMKKEFSTSMEKHSKSLWKRIVLITANWCGFNLEAWQIEVLKLTKHQYFEGFILFIIVVSSITVAVDNPLMNPESPEAKVLWGFDIAITIVFSIEMTLKMFALGLWCTKGYFSNKWNILEFIIVVVSVTSLAGQDQESVARLAFLRSFRALRPLRLLNRLPGLKAIVLSLVKAAPAVSQISFVFVLVYFIFAILFTSFLKGQIRHCAGDVMDVVYNNTAYYHLLQHPEPYASLTPYQQSWFQTGSPVNPTIPSCTPYIDQDYERLTSRVICSCWEGSWSKLSYFTYDNVLQSMLTLFNVGSLDNWSIQMQNAADTNGIDMEPIRNINMRFTYLFILFIFVGNFMCVQLFVGVITSSFERCKDELGGVNFLSEAQQEWFKTRKIIVRIRPVRKSQRPKGSRLRGRCYDICTNIVFDGIIVFCIIYQTILLSIVYFGMSDEQTQILSISYTVIAAVFILEASLKLTGFGIKAYFQDYWNCMDFTICVLSVVAFIAAQLVDQGFGPLVNSFRIIRVIRLVRLLKGIPTLQALIDTIILTLPGVLNISILLFLFLYVFAVVGVNSFATTAYYQEYNSHANFRTFGDAFLTLIRFTTGDDWGVFMFSIYHAGNSGCVENPPYDPDMCGFSNGPECVPLDGCGNWYIIPYMIVYIVLICFVFLSVFISVIISNYSEVSHVTIHPLEYQAFAEHWAEFDPKSTCYISLDALYLFVATAFAPFGFDGKPFSMRQYMKRVGKLPVNPHNHKVHFSDVILGLSAAHFRYRVKWTDDGFFDTTMQLHPSGKKLQKAPSEQAAPMESFAQRKRIVRLSTTLTKQKAMRGSIVMEEEGGGGDMENRHFTVLHYLAAEMILQAWRFRQEMREKEKEKERKEAELELRSISSYYSSNASVVSNVTNDNDNPNGDSNHSLASLCSTVDSLSSKAGVDNGNCNGNGNSNGNSNSNINSNSKSSKSGSGFWVVEKEREKERERGRGAGSEASFLKEGNDALTENLKSLLHHAAAPYQMGFWALDEEKKKKKMKKKQREKEKKIREEEKRAKRRKKRAEKEKKDKEKEKDGKGEEERERKDTKEAGKKEEEGHWTAKGSQKIKRLTDSIQTSLAPLISASANRIEQIISSDKKVQLDPVQLEAVARQEKRGKILRWLGKNCSPSSPSSPSFAAPTPRSPRIRSSSGISISVASDSSVSLAVSSFGSEAAGDYDDDDNLGDNATLTSNSVIDSSLSDASAPSPRPRPRPTLRHTRSISGEQEHPVSPRGRERELGEAGEGLVPDHASGSTAYGTATPLKMQDIDALKMKDSMQSEKQKTRGNVTSLSSSSSSSPVAVPPSARKQHNDFVKSILTSEVSYSGRFQAP